MNAFNLAASPTQASDIGIWVEQLDVEHELWVRQPDGRWMSGAGQYAYFSDSTKPTLQVVEDQTYWITIPIAAGEIQLTFSKMTSDEDLLLSYARSIQREIENANDLQELQAENEEFTEQTISNFEQLAFLKNSARKLLLADTVYGMEAMAADILPSLQELISAADIQLFLIDADSTDPIIGGSNIAASSSKFLINEFANFAYDRPFVFNHWMESKYAANCPEIDNFIIASVKHCNHLLGWVIAINKSRADCANSRYDDLLRVSENEFGTVEAGLLSSAGSLLATHFFNVDLLREKELLLTNIIRSLASALDAKDPYTCGHSARVAAYAKRIAKEMRLADEQVEEIYLTGLLHDIGKIGIDDATLTHPGPLSEEQFEKIKMHPDGGWAILHEITQLRYVLPGVLYHHESFDGSGYPDGLAGTQIPIEARILAVADAYDAMTSSRPYRHGMSHDKAIRILEQGAGKQWDPDVVEVFLSLAEEVVQLGLTISARQQAYRKKGSIEAVCNEDSPRKN